MRLRVVVRPVGWSVLGTNREGLALVKRMASTPAFADPDRGLEFWRELDRWLFTPPLEVTTSPQTSVEELTSQVVRAVRGGDVAVDWGKVDWVVLYDPAGNHLPPDGTVGQADLADGDVVVLRMHQTPSVGAMMLPGPNPEALFASLQLAWAQPTAARGAQLWGVLLYTDADPDIATYVRTHFDELNALSGPLLRVFVLERPIDWRTARRYWKAHLEPPLLRTLGTLRWLSCRPYDRSRCYDIARELGVSADELPCLVLFRGVDVSPKLVFPITSASPAFFRRLFAELHRAAEGEEPAYDIEAELEETRHDPGRARRLLDRRAAGGEPAPDPYDPDAAAAQARAILRGLSVAATPRGDDALARVAAAEQRIRAALHADEPQAQTTRFHGYQVVVHEGRPAVSGDRTENFHFHGPTTFVNQPVDTVIHDFQNTHPPTAELAQLTELLRLVLSSTRLPPADRDEAARAVHEIAGTLQQPAKERRGIRARLLALRDKVTKAADIAEPALTIIARILDITG